LVIWALGFDSDFEFRTSDFLACRLLDKTKHSYVTLMKKLLKNIDRRFQLSRPGSVLILVVALLVLMALIGTAFLSSTRVDRYATVQHTNNTEMDLLVEGVKNMAKATIVGSLNDPSLPFPYRPANSTLAKNWDAPDLFHQYTDNTLITTTPNDAWLSPLCPSFHTPILANDPGVQASAPPTPSQAATGAANPQNKYANDPYGLLGLPNWSCLGQPLTGTSFESPFVLGPLGTGALQNVSMIYKDRITRDFVPPTQYQAALMAIDAANSAGPDTIPGNIITPGFATITNPDGTTSTYPAFTLSNIVNNGTVVYSPVNGYETGNTTSPTIPTATTPTSLGALTSYTYLAGDADGDGIADCGMFKLPVGPIDGVTFYAGVRIVDNCARVNVNTAMSRRYDFTSAGQPTRTSGPSGANAYAGVYNLGCFPSNVGLAELLQTYQGGVLGTEFSDWLAFHFNSQSPPPGVITSASPLATSGNPVDDYGAARTDFNFTTFGDLLSSQIGRRPGNPGNIASGYPAVAYTDTDAAAISYHFLFDNPNDTRSPLERALHTSIKDIAPNSANTVPTPYPTSTLITSATPPPGPITRSVTNTYFSLNGYAAPDPTATSYSGNANNSFYAVTAWYAENFDWPDQSLRFWENPWPSSGAGGGVGLGESDCSQSTTAVAGNMARNRRPILTANSAVSNLTPRPILTPPYVVAANGSITISSAMTPITPTLCKASINTAVFGDLWRAFWLGMTGDNGLSPLGTNSGATSGAGYTVPSSPIQYFDHDLATGQSIYTGSQFPVVQPTGVGASSSQSPAAFAVPITYPQHPQAMFRSSWRIPANTAATNVYYGGASTYSYIEPDQMVLLRSAIAAANAEAMRDPLKGSGANIHAHDISLVATVDGTPNQAVTARVFGVSQQPYITEIYANTNVIANSDLDASGNHEPTFGSINSAPYVAVELFNPYNQPINLTGWQLAVVNRSPASDVNRGFSSASVIYTFGVTNPSQPVYIPAYNAQPTTGTALYQGGYALLEDFNAASPSTVLYRPASSRLPAGGTLNRGSGSGTTGAPLADIYVENLKELIPATGVAGIAQELVLLRPGSNAQAAESQIDQVPVDSFDFTGLTYDTTGANADTWHYVRGNAMNTTNSNSLWRFIYPGRYDASDPTPYAATASSATIPTPTVTTGSRNVPNVNMGSAPFVYSAYSRRHQGTQAAHYDPADTFNAANKSDPFILSLPTPPPTLGDTVNLNDNPVASYPVTFPFQYLNNDEAGASPLLGAGVNAAPFGQFARNSDILQVPFVGSYIIFKTAPASVANGTPAALASGDLGANVYEVNSMPIDCSFAEDTDTTDDPPVSDASLGASPGATQYIWNESVGHFAPVNTQVADNGTNYRNLLANTNQTIADSDPTLQYTFTDPFTPYKVQNSSYGHTENNRTGDLNGAPPGAQKFWRYHWASRIFDYLTVQNPNDDYLPNVQQGIYTTEIGQPKAPQPVQNTSLISPAASVVPANPNTEDTVPVYGSLNINTVPWRVLSELRICPYDDSETTASNASLADQYTINPATGTISAGSDSIPDNVEVAQALANWRDAGPYVSNLAPGNVSNQVNTTSYPYGIYKGPFTSVADLLNVPVVQNYLQKNNFQQASLEPDDVHGHFLSYTPIPATTTPPSTPTPTPASPTPFQVGMNAAAPAAPLTDGVRNDQEERFDLLDRLSNQVSVKSDTYTVYIVVQGWRNAGSTSASNPPQMVSQKRAAFIIDRTGVTPTSSNVKIVNVPTD
jgi:hypothetical protein